MKFRERHGCREFPLGVVGGTTMTRIQIKAFSTEGLRHLLLDCYICRFSCFMPPARKPSKDWVPSGTFMETGIVLGLATRLGTQNSGSWNEPAAETQVSRGRSNPSTACSPPQPLEDSAAPAGVSWEMALCGWRLFPSGRVDEALWVHRSSGSRAPRYRCCVKDSDCLLFQLHSGICKRQTGRNAAQNRDLNTHI